MGRLRARLMIGAAALAALACAPRLAREVSTLMAGGQYENARALLEDDLKLHPNRASSWRDLGIVCYKLGDPQRAESHLSRAAALEVDAVGLLHLGLVHEELGKFDEALEDYRMAIRCFPRGQYAVLVRGRLESLERERATSAAQLALASEKQLLAAAVNDSAVALYSFDSSRLRADLVPLGRGIAELVALDLEKLASLRVVERLRVEALLRELALTTASYSDPRSSPRLGHLLGGRYVVSGNLIDLDDDRLRLALASVDVRTDTVSVPEPSEEPLAHLPLLQKRATFSIVAALGVPLTPEEKAALAVPATTSAPALLAYSRGLQLLSRSSFDAALTEFRAALRLDPGFAAAQEGADAAVGLLTYGALPGGATGFPQVAETAASAGGAIGLQEFQTEVADRRFGLPADPLADPTNEAPVPPLRAGDALSSGVTVSGHFDED